jgi:hypothetical protein
MARYTYYGVNGANKADFRNVELDDLEVGSGDNGNVIITITDDNEDNSVRAIINLAPGEYFERRD